MRTRQHKRRATAAAKEIVAQPAQSAKDTPPAKETTTPPTTQGECSELNNVSGGSPSSGDSPSSRKKPRTEEEQVSEIDVEAKEPESKPVEEERRVLYFTQYMCISLWRSFQSCEIWDHRLLTALCQGPKNFTDKVHTLAQNIQHRVKNVNPEAIVESYLKKLRPQGLYSSCAKIWQKANLGNLMHSLKRKRNEDEVGEQKQDMMEEDEDEDISYMTVDDGQYKYRFVMEQPRLMIVNGPDKDEAF